MLTREEIFKKYIEHASAYVNWKKIDGENPDEQFMRSIEEEMNVSVQACKWFREVFLIEHQRSQRKGLVFRPSMIPRMDEAISSLEVIET